MFPALGKQRHTATPLSVPSRRLLRPWDRASGTGHEQARIQAGFRPPFACTPQPFKADPRSGDGRLPKAPRVCVCETQPRAPHRPVRVSPFQPALALSHFRIASRSAPHWTGREQDKRGFGDGDKEYKKIFSLASSWACAPDAAQRGALAERCAADPGSRLLAMRRNRGPGSAKQRFAKCYAIARRRRA
jgi:hypothetical protein